MQQKYDNDFLLKKKKNKKKPPKKPKKTKPKQKNHKPTNQPTISSVQDRILPKNHCHRKINGFAYRGTSHMSPTRRHSG